jgi:hypothetical protein
MVPQRIARLKHGFSLRVAVILAAIGILYLRTPITFGHPQFWGEDALLFHASRLQGWSSLSIAWAGYLSCAQFLVALLAGYFSPTYAAAIYCYAAIFLTIVVVWLVTSPRLEMPYKPLLAIAVVIVPMGYEELGTLVNIQWILPIGTFAMMFMRASKSWLVLLGEAVFCALMAVSGPFSIFLTPMFLWQVFKARGGADRWRMVALTAIVGLGALTQVFVITHNPGAVSVPVSVPYPWTLWVNLPMSHIMSVFPRVPRFFKGIAGVVLGAVLLAAAAVLALRPPYRTQKIFMLLFAVAIAVSGLYKFRGALGTQILAQRYFYAGSIFALWFICCMATRANSRAFSAAVVAVLELLLLPTIAGTPRAGLDLQWPVWSSYITSGLAVIIPTAPTGWFVGLPAAASGPLASYEPWLGQNIAAVGNLKSSSACKGRMELVEPLNVIDPSPLSGVELSNTQWTTSGSAWDSLADGPARLIALIDSTGKVVGFGLTGFRHPDENTPRGSGWHAIFDAAPGSTIRAYAILRDGQHICPFGNEQYFPLRKLPVASGRYDHAVKIIPGRSVVQSFKPLPGLAGISETFVNYAHVPSHYILHWRIDAYSDGHDLELGAGDIDASSITNWQQINLPLAAVPARTPDEIKVSIQTDAGAEPPRRPAGVPLYMPGPADKDPPAETGGIPDPAGLQLGLTVDYK